MQIKNHLSSVVIFEDQTSGITQRELLEKAVAKGADLRNADLCGTNLRNAALCGADLCGANLRNADLRNADLYGADLRNADLYGADLYGADLRNADLYGADLYGAVIEKGKLIGDRPHFSIQSIGSRSDTLELFITDNGAFVKTGCFFDSIESFKQAVKETHGDNVHAQEYELAIALFEMHIKLWKPEE